VRTGSSLNWSVAFYIDGQLFSQGTCATVDPAKGYNFAIGRPGDYAAYTNGLLDDLRIYNRALSPDEVKRLYLMGK